MQAQPSEEHYKALYGTYHRKDADVYGLRRTYILEMIAKLKEATPQQGPFIGNVVYFNELHDRIEYLLGFPMVPDQFALREKLREVSEE